jgi:hypothetical protein
LVNKPRVDDRQAALGRAFVGLKMPEFGPYDRPRWGSRPFMFRRMLMLSGLIVVGLALNGCTKCGPIWEDWMHSPKSCKSDQF